MKRRSLLLATIATLGGCQKQPPRTVYAKVIDIVPRLSRWHPDEVIITMQSKDGMTSSKTLLLSRLACRLGDTAKVKAQGVALQLDGSTCEQGPPLPPSREGWITRAIENDS